MTAIYLDDEQVASLLDMPSCIAALEEAFREEAAGRAAIQPRRRLPFQGRRFHLMAASMPEKGVLGFKAYGAAQDDNIFKFASDVYADQNVEIGVMHKMLDSIGGLHF